MMRRPPKFVTLFPVSSEPRRIELIAAQRDAAKTALENPISIICGPPGVGKTSVLTALVHAGGARVLITALAAAAVQRASEVTGGRAVTVHSLTTRAFKKRTEFVPRPDALDGIDTLIIDEASMVGSRQLATLLEGCDQAGGRPCRVVRRPGPVAAYSCRRAVRRHDPVGAHSDSPVDVNLPV